MARSDHPRVWGEAEDHGSVFGLHGPSGRRLSLAAGTPYVTQPLHLCSDQPLPQAHRFQGLSPPRAALAHRHEPSTIPNLRSDG